MFSYTRRAMLAGSLLSGLRGATTEVAVAAASNLAEVLQKLIPRFEAVSRIHAAVSFGSTAQLSRQIENGAPFDVFAAADSEHVVQLDREGLLAPGSRAVYATGVLALWIPPQSRARIERLQDLAAPQIKVIAVAKPELAPYGEASVEALRRAGVWRQVKDKVVYAENINMTRQYGASGNADAVFTAYSLVLKATGQVIVVDEKLHAPIAQELGIVKASRNQAAARQFAEFLLHGAGREILRNSGYR